MTIERINTILDDDRTRLDIAEDVAAAINEHADGGASAKVWAPDDEEGQVAVYINGGSAKGYGRVKVAQDGSLGSLTHRTACTNVLEVLRAMGVGRLD